MSEKQVNERSIAQHKFKLIDETGTALTSAQLNAITLTLYDVASDTIINSRSYQNVLNANGGALDDGTGIFTMKYADEDNVIIGSNVSIGGYERHVALYKWTYNGNQDENHHEISIMVRNLHRVPQP